MKKKISQQNRVNSIQIAGQANAIFNYLPDLARAEDSNEIRTPEKSFRIQCTRKLLHEKLENSPLLVCVALRAGSDRLLTN